MDIVPQHRAMLVWGEAKGQLGLPTREHKPTSEPAVSQDGRSFVVVHVDADVVRLDRAAEAIGVPPTTLRDWARSDPSFPARPVGKHWLVDLKGLREWLRERPRERSPQFAPATVERKQSRAVVSAKPARIRYAE